MCNRINEIIGLMKLTEEIRSFDKTRYQNISPAYEVGSIFRQGIKRSYVDQEYSWLESAKTTLWVSILKSEHLPSHI